MPSNDISLERTITRVSQALNENGSIVLADPYMPRFPKKDCAFNAQGKLRKKVCTEFNESCIHPRATISQIGKRLQSVSSLRSLDRGPIYWSRTRAGIPSPSCKAGIIDESTVSALTALPKPCCGFQYMELSLLVPDFAVPYET